MFELTEQASKVVNVNPRPELHGEDPKPAADLHFEAKLSNDCLAMFAPSLRSSLYMKDDAQPDLVSQADPSHRTKLQFPKLGAPLKWKDEIAGATVTVHYGATERSNIVLANCTVGKFELEPEEGGTVVVGFRVQCHPTEEQAGKLCMMVGLMMPVTVTPPAAAEELKAAA
jgi:hypothetical protein